MTYKNDALNRKQNNHYHFINYLNVITNQYNFDYYLLTLHYLIDLSSPFNKNINYKH